MASLQFVWFCHQMSSGIKLVKNQKNPQNPCLDFQRFGNLELQVGNIWNDILGLVVPKEMNVL